MKSIRNLIKSLEEVNNFEDTNEMIEFVNSTKDEILSLLDDIESIVNDAECAVEDINKSVHIDLDDIEECIKECSKSLY